jgi:CheY-like chemotaxis protein
MEALERAREVDPDVIVLDINMPGLDGFQTMRALDEAGSRAPVVFLSMLSGEDEIAEAFRCGGRGYVQKLRVVRDLPGALDQVLDGRLVVPSLPSLLQVASSGHVLHVHSDAKSFLDGLADLFDLALRSGDATCLIVAEHVREGLGSRLRHRGWDVDRLNRYRVIDAADALDGFMRHGMPDAHLLTPMAAELEQYRRAVTEDATSRLTIYGEMAGSLAASGNPEAAIALESLWDKLSQGLPFVTICGYSSSCVNDRARDVWPLACARHHIVSYAGDV